MTQTDGGSLEVQEKQELNGGEEQTTPGRFYVPKTDIYERADAICVVMEMPGVDKDGITIRVEEDVLHIEGHIDFANYDNMQPVYTEYNIGHFSRHFSLSSKIDQDKISASTNDGVLQIVLPKAEEAKPKKIEISAA